MSWLSEFLNRPELQEQPFLEPQGFPGLRDMLMQRIFEMQANPYGMHEGGMGYSGPSPLLGGGRKKFNPYGGGQQPMMGGGGGDRGMPTREPRVVGRDGLVGYSGLIDRNVGYQGVTDRPPSAARSGAFGSFDQWGRHTPAPLPPGGGGGPYSSEFGLGISRDTDSLLRGRGWNPESAQRYAGGHLTAFLPWLTGMTQDPGAQNLAGRRTGPSAFKPYSGPRYDVGGNIMDDEMPAIPGGYGSPDDWQSGTPRAPRPGLPPNRPPGNQYQPIAQRFTDGGNQPMPRPRPPQYGGGGEWGEVPQLPPQRPMPPPQYGGGQGRGGLPPSPPRGQMGLAGRRGFNGRMVGQNAEMLPPWLEELMMQAG